MRTPSFGSGNNFPAVPRRAIEIALVLAATAIALLVIATVEAFAGDVSLPPADKQTALCEASTLPPSCTLALHRGARKLITLVVGSADGQLVATSVIGRLSAGWVPTNFATNTDLLDPAFITRALQYHTLTAEQTAAAQLLLHTTATVAYLDLPHSIRPADNSALGLSNSFTARVYVQFVKP